MTSNSFLLKYASERRNAAASAGMRLLAAVALFVAACCSGGCLATQMKAGSTRPVDAGMEVFVQASIGQHTMDNVCIFPFISPPEIAGASASLTSAFQSRLVQRGPFRQIKVLPYDVKSDPEALWYARNEGCTLLMRSAILYMMDGTGAMPTQLVVRIRILDARTGDTLWDVKQKAQSEPGCDIDLTWNTFTGEPAQRCQVLAESLAQRFAEYLVKPLEKKN